MPQSLIVTASRKGSIHVATQLNGDWVSEKINTNWPEGGRSVLSIYPIPMLQSFLAIWQETIDLVDVEARTIIHTFSLVKPHAGSVQCFYSNRRTSQCGPKSLASFSLVYTERESGDCVLQTYSPRRQDEALCINVKKCPEDHIHCSWNNVIVQVHRTKVPGKWSTLPIGAVVGVRKRPSPAIISNGDGQLGARFPSSQIRRRSRSSIRADTPSSTEDDDIWEAWMLSAKGERDTVTLGSDENGGSSNGHLLVSSCGPIIRSGQRSIVVGMGNVVKVITVCGDRFSVEETSDDMVKAMSGRRRRLAGTRKRSMAMI
jgi:hypothetical protein